MKMLHGACSLSVNDNITGDCIDYVHDIPNPDQFRSFILKLKIAFTPEILIIGSFA